MRIAIICPRHEQFASHLAERLDAEPGVTGVVVVGPGDETAADLVITGLPAVAGPSPVGGRAGPVVVIAPASTSAERTALLDAGFDQVIHGTISVDEIVAQVRAIARRQMTASPAVPPAGHRPAGVVEFDPVARRARSFGRQVRLTELQTTLLLAMMAEPGRTFSHDELLIKVWGSTAVAPSTLSTSIRRLRAKLEPDPANPVIILTSWGAGYRLDLTPAAPGDAADADLPERHS